MTVTQIQTSEYTVDAHAQADGSRYVIERHTDTLGRVLTFGPYLLPDGADPQAVMTARATRLNAEFVLRAAEESAAAVGRTPWSKLEFRNALGAEAEQWLDALIARIEVAPLPSEALRDQLRTGFRRYAEASYIERPLRSEVITLLGVIRDLGGPLTTQQIGAIVAAAEGGN